MTQTSVVKSNLQRLVAPATWLLARLRFAPKFVLIGGVLLVPLLFVAYLQFSGTTKSMVFNQYERYGMDYMEPLHDYVGAQQRHWVAAVGVASGAGKDAAAALATANEDVARLEKAVDAIDAKIGKILKSRARWAEAKAEWAQAVAITGKGTAEQVSAAHDKALKITTDLITNYVANFSNLILDPDLDSYWLMDFAVVKAPVIGNQIASLVSGAVIKHGDRMDQVMATAGPLTALQGLVSDTKSINLKTAVEQTKNFGKSRTLERNLTGPMTNLVTDTDKLIDRVRENVLRPALETISAPAVPGGAPTPQVVDTASVVRAGIDSLNALDTFYDANNPELTQLIQRRVDNYSTTRVVGVVVSIIGVLLVLYIFAGLYYGVAGVVQLLGGATTRMVSGTTEVFDTPNRDETAEIVRDFNTINKALIESRELQQRVSNENAQVQRDIVSFLSVVSDASDGDLTVRASTTEGTIGNIADAFNLLMNSLEELVGDVTKQVKSSDAAVRSIEEVARKMARGATSQTEGVSTARRLVDDVAKQIAAASNSSESASSATRTTAATAIEGVRTVEDVIGGMESLRANVQSGAKKMKNLGDRSMEITSIVGTISKISEQTNMLALNAAIEAARAGEHGRGFRVVADEVRKLAERAANATKDIEKLVSAINAETTETIKAIEQQTQIVEEESRVVSAAGDSLRKIRESSEASAALVAGFTEVTRAQIEQAKQVTGAMDEVSRIARETETGAQSTATTVATLVTLSAQLQQSINRFRVGAR